MLNNSSLILPLSLDDLSGVSAGKSTSSTISDYGNACLAGAGAGGFVGSFFGLPGAAAGAVIGCAGGLILQSL
jgi:hypothetical protein